MKILFPFAALPLLAACAASPATAPVPRAAPLIDYHQHLVSPGFEPIVKMPGRDGAALVKELDAAASSRRSCSPSDTASPTSARRSATLTG